MHDKIVADYTGMSIRQVEHLGLIDYLIYLRDACIHARAGTKEGREYLRECWILQQTKPDRARLRTRYGEG